MSRFNAFCSALAFGGLLAGTAAAAADELRTESWMVVDTAGTLAWGVEESTARYIGREIYFWSVGVTRTTESSDLGPYDFVVTLQKYDCVSEDGYVAIASYAYSLDGESVQPGSLRPVGTGRVPSIDLNPRVIETICNLGRVDHLSLYGLTGEPTPAAFAAARRSPRNRRDELWMLRGR